MGDQKPYFCTRCKASLQSYVANLHKSLLFDKQSLKAIFNKVEFE